MNDRFKFRVWDIEFKKYYPAPTLDEILARLPEGTLVMRDAPGVWTAIAGSGTTNVKIEKASTPEAAALRLWFKVKGDDDVR